MANIFLSVGQVWLWAELAAELKWPNLPLTDYFQIPVSCDSSFKMEKKLTMFYIEAHNPLVIKI